MDSSERRWVKAATRGMGRHTRSNRKFVGKEMAIDNRRGYAVLAGGWMLLLGKSHGKRPVATLQKALEDSAFISEDVAQSIC